MQQAADSDPLDALHAQLRAHPADRHPLQHATAQFHLGGVLLDRGSLTEAEAAFTTAAALFAARGAHPEQAKAMNGLGATLRAAGRTELAARALEHAAAGLAAAGMTLDEGAAHFNLGLVLRDAGRAHEASIALERAVELLDPARVPAQAAAATRELGAVRLELGRTEEAEAALVDAVALADRGRDDAARAAAANTLGLARLAAGRLDAAIEAFAAAAADSPRSVRPEAWAMASANLAVACERAGALARARIAARHALAAPVAAEPVRAQAAAVLERLGPPGAPDLRELLTEDATDEARSRLVREELARSADAPEAERAADMRTWIDLHSSWPADPADAAELWLHGLLDLPPDALERMVRSALAAGAHVDPDARESFRGAVVRAMARFHVPQWMRLQDVFAQAADELGDPGPWR